MAEEQKTMSESEKKKRRLDDRISHTKHTLHVLGG